MFMPHYIIGKIAKQSNYITPLETGKNTHAEAYKIYDTKSKKSYLIGRKELLNLLGSGYKIAGYRRSSYIYNTLNTQVLETYLCATNKSYDAKKLDIVDGNGRTLGPPKTFILIGQYKFGDQREYICIDANGVQHQLKKSEFIKKIKENNIMGASLINNEIHISRASTRQYY